MKEHQRALYNLQMGLVESVRLREERAIMKKCHACGQKLPLKVGDVVGGKRWQTRESFEGIVTGILLDFAHVTTFRGTRISHPLKGLTRLHGYYRITERESMV